MNAGNPSFTELTDRGPSPSLWEANGAHSRDEIDANPTLGWYDYDEFTDSVLFTSPTLTTEVAYGTKYKAFGTTGGTIARPTTVGVLTNGVVTTVPDTAGIMQLALPATDNAGIAIQQSQANHQIYPGTGKVFFEGRVKNSLVTAVSGWILGLMELRTLTAIDPITAAGAVAAGVDYCGFHKQEAVAGYIDTAFALNGTETVVDTGSSAGNSDTAGKILVANEYTKLGFFYDAATGLVKWYRNGKPYATTKLVSETAGSGFPNNVLLAPTFAMVNASAAVFSAAMDWWYAQTQPRDNVT